MKTQLTKNNGSITSIMAFAFALLCAIGISGCGSNSAEDVAKSFTKAMAKEDIEDAFEMFQWPVMGLVLDVKTVEKARILFMKQYNDYWKHGKGVGYELSPITVAKK